MLRLLLLFAFLVRGLVPAAAEQDATRPAPNAAAEEKLCLTCHADTASYLHTAHHATSSVASTAQLAALVRVAGDRLEITRAPLPAFTFLFRPAGGVYTQTAETRNGANTYSQSEPMDLTIGSDKRGLTFLSWKGNQLVELPVSFWKEGSRWINSPGYLDGTADFRRPVQPGCLECHAAAATAFITDPSANAYFHDSLVLGIRCRTCHGDGAAHIAAEQQAKSAHLNSSSDAAILNPAHFTRDRQIDLCALCHSGIQRSALQPAFSYIPGKPLSEFFQYAAAQEDQRPDVHGNQVGLLRRSPCFRNSQMTCSTCHNTHTVGLSLAGYSVKCQSCHQWQSCPQSHKLGAFIKTRCVECHMPVQQTAAIVSTTAGATVQAAMRTHWIKVY